MTLDEKFLDFRDAAEEAYPPLKKHLQPLYDRALEAPGKLMLELGSETGTSSVALLYAAAQKDKILYSVDISPCDRAHSLIKARDLHQRWKFLQEDDRNLVKILHEFDLPEIVRFGLIFVDTSHEYDHTVEEIGLYSPFVAPNGFLIFHDFNTPEVRDPVIKFLSDNSTNFTYQDTFSNEHGVQLLICQRNEK